MSGTGIKVNSDMKLMEVGRMAEFDYGSAEE
jgi:hypothetical protein